MTVDEAKEVFREIFIVFPHMHRYLNDCADADATLAEWCKMLGSVKLDHARLAVTRWKSGEADPPDKPWEMGLLPLKLRAVAGKIADQAAKAEKLRMVQAETEQRTRSRSKSNFGRLMQASLDNGEMYKIGLISEERNKEILKEIESQIGNSDCILAPEIEAWRKSGRKGRLEFSDIKLR